MKLTLAAILVGIIGAVTAPAEIWKHEAGDDVRWMKVSFAGNFLYGTDAGIYSLDPAAGTVVWKREDLKKIPESSIEEIDGTPVLLVAESSGNIKVEGHVTALDLTSGETLWQSERAKGSVAAVVPVFNKDMVIVVNAMQGGKNTLQLLAINLASGKVLWESAIEDKADLYVAEKTSKLFPKFDLHGHAAPTIDGNDIYFVYAGVHKVDLNTGKVLWKQVYDVTEKNFIRTNASPIVTPDTVFTSANGIIRSIDKTTGAIRWTSADFGTGVAQMELVDGVVYGRMGGVFQTAQHAFASKKPIGVVALDPATGKLKWRYEGAQESVTNMLILPAEKSIMIADAKNLIGLSLDASGDKVKETFKVPLEFKAKQSGAAKAAKIGFGALRGGAIGALKNAGGPPAEPPLALMRRENGLVVVRGTQNVMGFDPVKKELTWSVRVEPPGMSTFNKIATSAAFAMSYTMSTAQAASTYYGTSENDWANADRRRTAEQWEKSMAKRYKKTANTNEYVYMLSDVKTDEGKGPGLTGVNLSTGEEERTAYFGDREPEYVADEIDGIIFRTHKNGKTIIAIQVK